MGQDEGGLDGAQDIDQPVFRIAIQSERIVAEVEADQVVGAQHFGSILRLLAPHGLYLVQRRALLLPQPGALAALAERQADDRHVDAALTVQCNRAAAAPHEIRRMGADDKRGSPFAHGVLLTVPGRRT